MVGCGNCGHKWQPRSKEFPMECPECRKPTSEGLYYIQNRGTCGNCVMFWYPDGEGYGCNIDEIGKYPRNEAWGICYHRPDIDVMWPVEFVEARAVRHFDFQSIKSGPGNSR